MLDAAEAMQVEATLSGTPDVSAAAVIALARKAIEEGVDGLALNVSEAGSFAPVIAEAKAKGIPCVAFNIDADKGASGNLSYVAQDFVPAGRALGRRVAPRGTVDVGARLGLPPLPTRDVMLHANVSDPQSRNSLKTLAATIRASANF